MPVEYEDIIKSCWNPEPERRPTAEAVADALKALQLKGLSGAMTAETKEYLAWRREMHVSEVAAGSEAEADDCDFENGRQTSGISLASDDLSRFYSYEELNDIGGEAESSVAIDSVSQR
ncbi:hypothetical protein BC938DRAFT_482301 [Jimgerdemannia flammicorona]|uniref:Serine-threonine/tyrosine-protein kinase catalytic domain-containing protein n=1 Tax=Jimgerdemannia flammicorona TaxID=994334 RepID=A0A433QWM0_9FUNG|nr:hypothetical protein BC938DRAFT_482301 [Jimgerdemannia flammicorona]